MIIPLYSNYIIKKLALKKLDPGLSKYDYLLFSEKYPDGKILSFREFMRETRKFNEVDDATAVVIQLPKDSTLSYNVINGLYRGFNDLE